MTQIPMFGDAELEPEACEMPELPEYTGEVDPPDGLRLRTPEWHFEKFVEFTRLKGEIGEPSPHLAIVGHMARDEDERSTLWLLGTYAATYCLPTAQVLWSLYDPDEARTDPAELERWLETHWAGIVTRTERRCVRTPAKMADCLNSYATWMVEGFPKLKDLPAGEYTRENYDRVWNSVKKIRYFGRYINIRLVEGLRRYLGIPAMLYDIRSIGGWSPKRCLCYLYPEHTNTLLRSDAESNALTDELAYDLLGRAKVYLPDLDTYVLAAMLCEYKGAFENRHQYPGWTIDQEPLLYDKVFDYWGEEVDRQVLWEARRALFPEEVLGEVTGAWYGTRWDLARVLRDHGYNWSDLKYDFATTQATGRWANPIEWEL